jgi:hypothetical protein
MINNISNNHLQVKLFITLYSKLCGKFNEDAEQTKISLPEGIAL